MFTHNFSDIGYPLLDLPCNNTISISSKSKHADFNVNFQDLFNNPEIKAKCNEKKFGCGFNFSNNIVKFKVWPSFDFFSPRFSIISDYSDDENVNPKVQYKLKLPCKIKNVKLCFASRFNKEDHLTSFAQEVSYKNQPGSFKIKNKFSMPQYSIYSDKIKLRINRSTFLFKMASNNFWKSKFTIAPPLSIQAAETFRHLLNTSISFLIKKEEGSISREKCRVINVNNRFICGLSYDFLKDSIKLKNCSKLPSKSGKVAFALRYSKKDSFGVKIGIKYLTRFGKIYANLRSYPENTFVAGLKTQVNDSCNIEFYGGFIQNQVEPKKMWSINLEFSH